MPTRRLLAFAVLLGATFSAALDAAADDKQIEQWKSSTWQLSIALDAPKLVPPAVQFAILDKDPLPGFRATVQRMLSYHESRMNQAKNEQAKKIQLHSAMTVYWDLGFKEVTGDRLYLLTTRSAKGGPAQSAHTISSNSPDGKKWVITKIVQIDGEPVCWCLPVEVKKGQEVKVTLTKDNLFDLASAFSEVTGKPVETGPAVIAEQPAGTATLPDKAGAAATTLVAVDRFNGKLALNWQPVRFDPSHVSLEKHPGCLTITTQRGTIHRNEKERGEPSAKNIFVLENPLAKDADFAITTCISGFTPQQAFQQAGLICYHDDDNYVKWDYLFDWQKGSGQILDFLRETDAESTFEHVPAPTGFKQLWLRLTKRGHSYEYAASTDGKNFTVYGSQPWEGTPSRVGILAKNGGREGVPEVDVCFEMFELRSLPSPAAAAVPAKSPTGIAGSWRAASMVQNGEQVPAATIAKLLLVFSEKNCTLRVGPQVLAETPYSIDAKATPATIDMTFNGQVTTGIYQRSGNDLQICLNEVGKGRPKAIPADAGSGCDVDLRLKRADLQWNVLHVMDADGSNPRVLVRHPEYTSAGSPEWSWDGRKLAFDAWRSIYGETFVQAHIFTVNADGSQLKDLGPGVMPSWSPDGKRLAFTCFEPHGVCTMNADGSGRKLLDKVGWAGEWCPQGDKIACYTTGDDEGNIRVHDLQKGNSRLLLDHRYPQEIQIGMAWSPDGQWLAFRGVNDDGKTEVAIVDGEGAAKGFRVLLPQALPEMTGIVGGQPLSWSPDSKQLLALLKTKEHPMARLYLIDIEGKTPARLLPGQSESRKYNDMCWSPDGKHIAFCGPPVE